MALLSSSAPAVGRNPRPCRTRLPRYRNLYISTTVYNKCENLRKSRGKLGALSEDCRCGSDSLEYHRRTLGPHHHGRPGEQTNVRLRLALARQTSSESRMFTSVSGGRMDTLALICRGMLTLHGDSSPTCSNANCTTCRSSAQALGSHSAVMACHEALCPRCSNAEVAQIRHVLLASVNRQGIH